MAGYEKQKRDIEDTVLLALTYPEIFDEITKETRMKNEPNRLIYRFFISKPLFFMIKTKGSSV